MLYQNVLLTSRIHELEEQLDKTKKRKGRKRKRIQKGGIMEYSIGASRVAIDATIAYKKLKNHHSTEDHRLAQLGLRQCGKYGNPRHNS